MLIANSCFSWINPYLELNFISTDSVITKRNQLLVYFVYLSIIFVYFWENWSLFWT